MELFEPKYIFDSGPFIDMKQYPNDVFTTLWDNFFIMLQEGQIISSSEVLRELKDYDDEIGYLAKSNSHIFVKPTIEEQTFVQEVLARFPELLKRKNILAGKPIADPFVIAQARIHDCILVHAEKHTPNSHRIPGVCKHYGVKEMSLFDFFREEKWKF